mgnify:CR=1 FL=1
MQDDTDLINFLRSLTLDLGSVARIPDYPSAQATIVTDPTGRQFTAFFSGPPLDLARWQVQLDSTFSSAVDFFVQAPLSGELMLQGLQTAHTHKVRTAWCPGQFADSLSTAEITDMVPLSNIIVGNEDEINCLVKRTNLDASTVIRSAGPQSIHAWCGDASRNIPIPVPEETVDPTGCGDALLAGIVYELAGISSMPGIEELSQAAQCGIDIAQACLSHRGGQNHFVRRNS